MENKIGQNIKKYRMDQQWSQDTLAEKVYSTKSTISKWESGDIVPSVDVIRIIAKALHVSVYKIMGEKTPISSKIFNFFGKFLFFGFVWVHVDITFTGVVMGVALGLGLGAFFSGLGGFVVQFVAMAHNHSFPSLEVAIAIGYLIATPIFFVVFGSIALFLYTIGRSVHMFSRKFFWRYPKGNFKMTELNFVKKITKTQWITFGVILGIAVVYSLGLVIYCGVHHDWSGFNIQFK